MDECQELNIINIQERLKRYSFNNENNLKFDQNKYRQAAVLVLLVCIDGEWNLLFTKRSDSLRNHKGQVSFPGGAKEAGDIDIINTALREAKEEIGITFDNITIIGTMPEFLTISDYAVTPVIAVMDWPIELSISEDEVSKVFTIPVKWLQQPGIYEEKVYTHPSGVFGTVIFYNCYEGELLWGISAKITLELVNEILK
jgi:8-oxo-dGTP pyrophosphatase MutT (NUDIX family)